MTDGFDALRAGRGGWSYEQLDAAAERLQTLVTDTAVAQIGRRLAHEFDIAVSTDRAPRLSPPPGYRRPAAGAITTHVVARSRSSRPAHAEVQVTVWPALGGADVSDLLLLREGTDRSLPIDVRDVHPQPVDSLRDRLNGFVAEQVASVVAALNVAMQRAWLHGGHDS